jgi:spore maturation protein CgeB
VIGFDVFGHDWDKVGPELTGALIHQAVYGAEMYRILRRYRVQLNFLRPHNLHSHNMRTFETPASGAIMLAEDTIEHRAFFRPGLEAFYFASDNELVSQAHHLLSLSPEEAGVIRRRARARSVEQPYTYRDRVQLALGLIRQVIA